jgi:hypothetical protein
LVAVLVSRAPYSLRWPVTIIAWSAASAVAAEAAVHAAPSANSDAANAGEGTHAINAAANDTVVSPFMRMAVIVIDSYSQ